MTTGVLPPPAVPARLRSLSVDVRAAASRREGEHTAGRSGGDVPRPPFQPCEGWKSA